MADEKEFKINPDLEALKKALMAKFGEKNFSEALERARFKYDMRFALQQRRLSMNLDQKELAQLMNIKQQQVSRYESGQNSLPLERLYDFIHALDLELVLQDKQSGKILIRT
jgi:HTH-type transcriptional regulator/antitoxin HipB